MIFSRNGAPYEEKLIKKKLLITETRKYGKEACMKHSLHCHATSSLSANLKLQNLNNLL